MSSRSEYVLDNNVLRTACEKYYRFSFCPGFWDLLIHAATEKLVFSIDRIKKELLEAEAEDEQRDRMYNWLKHKIPDEFFQNTSGDDVAQTYGLLMKWAQKRLDIQQGAYDTFYRSPDAWLIAYCSVHKRVLVTEEVSAPTSKKYIKIPDAAREFGVRCVNTFEMLEELSHQLVFQAVKSR